MPWGSWITCEETVNGPDVGPDFTGASNVPLTKPHGFIFEVPAGGQSDRQPITQAGRFAHEAVAFDPQDGHPLPDRGQLRLPVRLLPLPPAAQPDAARAGSTTAAGCRCSPSRASPNPNLAAEQPRRATYDVTWVDIDDPAPDVPVHARPDRADDQRPGAHVRRRPGPGAGRGVLLPAGGLRSTTTTSSTSAPPRAVAPAETGPDPIATATATASARSGPTTPGPGAAADLPVAGRATLDFPDNVTTSKRGTLVRLRGQRQRQLPARPDPRRPAVRHRAEPARQQHRRAPVRRRVRRLDLQPGRAHAVRQHPGQPRHDFAIWGPGTASASDRLSGYLIAVASGPGRAVMPQLMKRPHRSGSARSAVTGVLLTACSPCAGGWMRRSSWRESVSSGRSTRCLKEIVGRPRPDMLAAAGDGLAVRLPGRSCRQHRGRRRRALVLLLRGRRRQVIWLAVGAVILLIGRAVPAGARAALPVRPGGRLAVGLRLDRLRAQRDEGRPWVGPPFGVLLWCAASAARVTSG